MSDQRYIKAMLDVIDEELAGWTITRSMADKELEYFGFVVEKAGKKKLVYVDQDPEGNGPGFLSINPS